MNEITDKEIVSSRVINAPRELVWRAYSEPEHAAAWWGPKGFTNTFRKFEFQPGGTWDFTMHGPGGRDFLNKSVFEEIVKPERIIFRHLKDDPVFKATIIFEELDGKTRIIYRMLFEKTEEYERVKKFAPQANEQNFDRLEAELARM